MNKEQQIKKMSTIIGNVKPFYVETIAEALYNAGYRKIDENCAVITKAELKEYKRQAVKKFADELKANCSEFLYYKNFDVKNNFDIHIDKIFRMIDELLKEYEK